MIRPLLASALVALVLPPAASAAVSECGDPSGPARNVTAIGVSNSPDYDCAGGSGNGPDYTGPVRVAGDDPHGLDRDGDGYACEA